MTIAVTGASGQLGGELCRQLRADAVGLDIDTLDVTDGEAVRKKLRELRPELVINCAAYTRVNQAEDEPDLCRLVNAVAVEHLARACSELGCPLVQISTDYVFGGEPRRTVPFCETDPPSPRSVYGRTKLAGERAAAGHTQHWIVRTCGLYARTSDDHARNFVKTMLRLAENGQKLRVVDDQHCTPSYVPHVARAIVYLSGAQGGRPAPWGIYHVTSSGATTWYRFACEIVRQAGIAGVVEPITTAEYGAKAPRPVYSVLDTSVYDSLGGPPMPDWRAALTQFFVERRRSRGDTEDKR